MPTSLAVATNDEKWELTKVGACITGDLTFDECRDAINVLATADTSVKFALADLVVYARENYGESYAQLLDELKFSMGYIHNLVWVQHNVPVENRVYDLSFSHFYEVASVKDKDEQAEWLRLCVENGWSREDLRDRMRGDMLELGPQHFVMPVNDRSALQTVIAWLDGRYRIPKSELRELLERYLNEAKRSETTRIQ